MYKILETEQNKDFKNFLDKKWYITECHDGEACWCRIVTINIDSDALEDCVVTAGALTKQLAEHIVELHNNNLENVSCTKKC